MAKFKIELTIQQLLTLIAHWDEEKERLKNIGLTVEEDEMDLDEEDECSCPLEVIERDIKLDRIENKLESMEGKIDLISSKIILICAKLVKMTSHRA
jgi:hypothetical protein